MKSLLNYVSFSIFFLLVFASCRQTNGSLHDPEYKTFETLKNHAVFLNFEHDKIGAFSDEELKVIKVTNLNKSGEGSLAWAVDQSGPRIVVFEVGGIIDMDGSTLKIRNPYLFVAGQTAPAPGITLIRGGISLGGHDVIMQHINVRPGDRGLAPKSGWEEDGLSTIAAYNVVIDHCSFTWATDENLSASGPRHEGADKTSRNITFSNCIIAECLHESTHSKVIHSMGTLVHDYCRNIAIVGNLYAHNNQRHPLMKPNAAAYLANNLIYNPKSQAMHASWPLGEYEGRLDSMRQANLTAIGNVMIPGRDTKKDIYMIFGKMIVYSKDNMICRNVDDSKGNKTERIISPESEEIKVPFINADRYKVISSEKVAASVLKNAGSRPKTRDAIDQRIVNDVKSGGGKVLNSQDEVGGYPTHEPAGKPLSVPEKNIEKWLENLSRRLI